MKARPVILAVCAVATIAIGLGASAARAADDDDDDDDSRGGPVSEVTVNCSQGESIADALELATPGTRLTITIVGTCIEQVYIAQNDITLQGLNPDESVIDANRIGSPISVDGGHRIYVDRLTLRGGEFEGIAAFLGASLILTNSVIRDNGLSGVFVGRNASAIVDTNEIRKNGSDGILVLNTGSAGITNNTIEYNARRGVTVANNSSADIGREDGDAGPNLIQFNESDGVLVSVGSSIVMRAATIQSNNESRDGAGLVVFGGVARLVGDNVIRENSYGISVEPGQLSVEEQGNRPDEIRDNRNDGVIAVNSSSLLINQGLIEGNGTAGGGDDNGISVNDNSYMRIRRATVRNNNGAGIVLRRGGGVLFRPPNANVVGHAPGEFDLSCRPETNEAHYGAFDNADLNGIGSIDPNCEQVFP